MTKGVKIEDIEHNEKLAIKKVIASNLHIYLRYGTQEEIDSLKYNLNHISNLIISKNQIISLEITKPIFKVYVDIKDFSIKRKYKVRGQIIYRDFNISVYLLLPLFVLGIVGLTIYHDQLNGLCIYACSNLHFDPINLTQAIIYPLIGTLIIYMQTEINTIQLLNR